MPPPTVPHVINPVLVAEGIPMPPPTVPHAINPILV